MAIQERGDRRRREHDTSTVRPYAVTGGRTTVSVADLPIEALVEGLVAPDVQLGAASRLILDLTATQYVSVAELSAHLGLPLGVVRVLVHDLAAARKLRVHGVHRAASSSVQGSPRESAAALRILESVLDGMSSL